MQILYILGSTRSGTSALRNAMATTRFAGYGEGHLVPLLSDVLEIIETQSARGTGAKVEGTGLFNLKPNVLIRHFFHGYERYLVSQLKSEFIIDKTPTIDPIHLAPQLNMYHANVRFIYCVRRHVDNIQSKRKKFADHPFLAHCREWTACHEAWLKAKPAMNENFLEIDFYDLATNPSGVAQDIGRYLELDAQDIENLETYLLNSRPEAKANRDLTQFLKLSELDWDAEDKTAFKRICGPVGQAQGYGFESYFAEEST